MTLSSVAIGSAIRRRWTPLALGSSALALWLDADDSTTLTLNGSKISTWADKSGNARNMTQGTDAQRPTTQSNIQNGKAIARFNRSGAHSTSSFMTNSASGFSSQPYSYIVVVKPDSTGGSKLYRVINGEAATGKGNLAINNSGKWEIWASTSFVPVAATTSWAIVGCTFNSTSSYFWLNGTQQGAASNAGTGVPASMALSEPNNANDHFSGDIGEVVVVAGTLTDADRQRIEGYFAHQWGLTANLPSDHPYKSFRP